MPPTERPLLKGPHGQWKAFQRPYGPVGPTGLGCISSSPAQLNCNFIIIIINYNFISSRNNTSIIYSPINISMTNISISSISNHTINNSNRTIDSIFSNITITSNICRITTITTDCCVACCRARNGPKQPMAAGP